MASRKLEVVIVGDSRGLEKAFGRAEKATDSFGKKATSGLSSLAKGGLVTAAVGGVALVTKSLFDSVGAARDAEKAQTRLESALKAANVSYAKHGDAIDAAIQKTSRLAALDDEDLSDAFAKLVRTTGSVTKATEGMNLAADIARARNISLESATKIVEKAMMGNETALKKVGVEITKNMSTTEALEAAQKKFAGSAAQYGSSAAGAQDKLNVAFENLQETVGAKLLPVLQRLALKLIDLINWSEKNWPAFRDAAVQTFNAIKPVIDNVVDRIQAVATMVQGVVRTIIAIKNGDWSAAWNGLKQVASGALDLIVAGFIALPAKILGAVSAKAFAGLSQIGVWIKNAVMSGLEGIGRGILGAIEGAINSAIGLLNSAIGAYNAIPLSPNIPKVPKVSAGGSGSATPPGLGKNVDKRAGGGPVSAGMPYIVGERGPELFVPGQSGGIVPNSRMGGGISIVVNGWVGNDQDIAARIQQELVRYGRRNTSIFSAPGVTV